MTTATRSSPRKPAKYSYGPEVVEWIEKNCVLPTGEWAGSPFRLMQWQKDWIGELYETDWRGKLRYRWALLGVPKGNGKSPLAAALALYHLLGDPDEADPWVVVAAASDKQADIVFDACRRMCELSPNLRDITIRFRWVIRPKDGLGKLERVAASKGKLDGRAPRSTPRSSPLARPYGSRTARRRGSADPTRFAPPGAADRPAARPRVRPRPSALAPRPPLRTPRPRRPMRVQRDTPRTRRRRMSASSLLSPFPRGSASLRLRRPL